MAINQISVFLENRTGQLAGITGLLARNNVDLRAISIAETADYGIVRIIADDANAVTTILRDAGHIFSLNPVQVISVPDRPGGLTQVLATLADADIAIDYMYSLFSHLNGNAYMVFRVSEEEKFVALMKSHGIDVVTAEALGIR